METAHTHTQTHTHTEREREYCVDVKKGSVLMDHYHRRTTRDGKRERRSWPKGE